MSLALVLIINLASGGVFYTFGYIVGVRNLGFSASRRTKLAAGLFGTVYLAASLVKVTL